MSHNINSRRTYFFDQIVITVATFPVAPQIKLPFKATHIVISNDSDDVSVKYSFLRPDIDGILLCDDQPFAMDGVSVDFVWFEKVAAGSDIPVRVWGWRL